MLHFHHSYSKQSISREHLRIHSLLKSITFHVQANKLWLCNQPYTQSMHSYWITNWYIWTQSSSQHIGDSYKLTRMKSNMVAKLVKLPYFALLVLTCLLVIPVSAIPSKKIDSLKLIKQVNSKGPYIYWSPHCVSTRRECLFRDWGFQA